MSVGTEVTGDGYNYLRFVIIFRIYNVFNTTFQCYKLTRQYNYSMFFLLHTLYKSVWVSSP
jgi:hypothetical protein